MAMYGSVEAGLQVELEAPRPKARRGVVTAIATVAALSVALAGAALDTRAKLRKNGGLHPWHPLVLAGKAESYIEVIVPMSTFLESRKVQAFLARSGVSKTSPAGELEKFVPRKITLQIWPERIKGEVGPAALEGYVAFNLAYYNGTDTATTSNGELSTTSSFLIVTDLYGKNVQISPTMRGDWDLHFCGLKLRDPKTFLLAGDLDTAEAGPAYLWKWGSDEYVPIYGGMTTNCHDIQWSMRYPEDNGAVWQPGMDTNSVELYNATNGDTLLTVKIPKAEDLNHVQLLDEDKYAIVSDRILSSIIKMDMTEESVQWYLGGHKGEFDIYDQTDNNKHYHKGEKVWVGQHNAEFFGSTIDADGNSVDEYYVFDNQYEEQTSSRLLIVQVNEDTYVANIVWSFKLGAYAPEYGDNDRMPTGNLLTCYWVNDFDVEQWAESGDADEQFDARVQEIVRSTKLPAWRASVQGPLCEEGTCKESFDTWKMYSVERFYDTPILWDVTCKETQVCSQESTYTAGTNATNGTNGTTGYWTEQTTCSEEKKLSFMTVNNFKQNNPDYGSYKMMQGEQHNEKMVGVGSFNFNAHWTPTRVHATLTCGAKDKACKKGTLYVVNKWGQTTTASYTCST